MELYFFPHVKYFLTLLNASQLMLKVSHTLNCFLSNTSLDNRRSK